MPWAKFSDTSAMHPAVLAPAAFVDWQPPRLTQTDVVNLLAGIFQRCAVQSAGYLTDYVVTAGVMAVTAGDNWQHWAALMVRAGYLAPIEVDSQPAWRLLDDPTHLVHIRLRDELEWEKQRRQDNGNPLLIVPVRLRDGDACRYCGHVVTWGDQKGNRGGTYDHRRPGQPATSPDDLRVACRACNARRKDDPDADTWCPPRPAPPSPYYGAKTVAMLAEHGHQVRRGKAPRPATQAAPAPTSPRPRTQRDTAPRDPATSRTPRPAPPRTTGDPATGRTTPAPATPPPAGPRAPRPGPRPDPAPRDPAPGRTPRQQHHDQDQHGLANPSNRLTAGFGSPGREGHGTGAQAPSPATSDRTRRRRGRRGRPQPPGEHHHG